MKKVCEGLSLGLAADARVIASGSPTETKSNVIGTQGRNKAGFQLQRIH